MSYFDVILRMDWLTKYQAIIKFYKKKVIFQIPKDIKVQFYGEKWSEPFQYYLDERRNQASISLLNSVEVEADNEKSLARIPIVNEY